MDFLPLENSDYVVVSVSIDFLSDKKQDFPFDCTACEYSHADWDSIWDHLRDFSLEDIIKLSDSVAGSEFCECVQFGIDVYIHHLKYQVKLTHLWFSAACAAAIFHRDHVFCLHQQ